MAPVETTAIVRGSLGAIAKQENKSLAETFLNADVVVIVDTSGSMAAGDSRDGRSRYEVACDELTNLQNSMPGKLAVISFADDVMFCPSGIPYNYGGGTMLGKALKFAKMADVPGIDFIVISDGEPYDEEQAIEIARTYKNKISTIFVGPEQDWSGGRRFLERLARESGGETTTADRAKELAAGVRLLLNG